MPRRVPGYRPEHLDALTASGEVVWVGAGPDRVALYFREDAAALGQVPHAVRPEGAEHDAVRAALDRGALFWLDLLEETALDDSLVLPALWDLVWAGEVTNDAWTPLRAKRRFGQPQGERRPRRFSRRRSQGATATAGRWSPTARLFAGAPDRRALAELLLERQGIVTRDAVRAEGIPGGYGAVYAELRALGDARTVSPRLLRGRSRRSTVRARRRCRAAARAARPAARRRGARPRSGRPGAAVRCRAAVAASCRGAGGARRRRIRRLARGRAGPLRRARRPLARAVARSRIPSGCAPRSRRSRPTSGRVVAAGSRSSVSTASRSSRPRRSSCWSRPGSWPAPGAPSYGRNLATVSAAGSARARPAFVPAQRLNPSGSPAARAAARSGAVR